MCRSQKILQRYSSVSIVLKQNVVDIDMNFVGHSTPEEDTNNTLLTQPKRKKNNSVRNEHNENYGTYEQLTKPVVCDKGQALVTQSNNQLMQDLLHLKRGTTVVGGVASLPEIEKSGNRKSQKPFGSPTRKGNKDGH